MLAALLSISDVGPHLVGEGDHSEEEVCERLDGWYTGSKWNKENVEPSSQTGHPPAAWRENEGNKDQSIEVYTPTTTFTYSHYSLHVV